MAITAKAVQSKSGVTHKGIWVNGTLVRLHCSKTLPKGAKVIDSSRSDRHITCNRCLDSSGINWGDQEPAAGASIDFGDGIDWDAPATKAYDPYNPS